ncbi:hypothetical protein [Pyxidicoccus trucidator]|uniref:hypothetical protein n=1 Tax=Pyxidicoccus trucidator TaxID=2709662 RepID=UPI001F079068|nr:hypothetical protein [Pyxidicoccus trucidator]
MSPLNPMPVLRRSFLLLGCLLAAACTSDTPFYSVQVDVIDAVSLTPGESTPVEITLSRVSDTPGEVRLSLENEPEGVTLSPDVILPAGEDSITATPTLAVAATTTAEAGLYRTQLLATDEANDRAAGATFFVVLLATPAAQPDFSISVEPRQVNLFAGQSQQVTVAVTRAEGFTGVVTLTLESPTSRVFAAPTTVPAGTTAQLFLVATDRATTRVPVPTTVVATTEDGRRATTGLTINVR